MKGKMICSECGVEVDPGEGKTRCPKCGGILLPRKRGERLRDLPGIFSYLEFFSSEPKEIVSMEEGNTPLMFLRRISEETNSEVYFKDERRNPTGTFIDRGSALLTSFSKGKGIRRFRIASLGDLGISLSAYSRMAGISSRIFMPRRSSPSKVYQTRLLAAKVDLENSYGECLIKASRVRSKHTMGIDPSNPYLLDGYRSVFLEIFLRRREKVEGIILPVGDGALLVSLYSCMLDLGEKIPLIGVRGRGRMLSEISVEKPLLSDLIGEAIEETGGEVIYVREEEAKEASLLLARYEGILMDFSGSSAISPVISGRVSGRVICIGTGAPLKDAATIRELIGGSGEGALGETKRRILELIGAYGEMHPYLLWKTLREKYGLEISLRATYSHVYELYVRGYLERSVKGRRTKYSLTEKGFEALG